MSHTGSGFASGAGRSHGRHQRERVSEVEQQAYSQGTFNSYQNDGYDDYDGDGGDDGYDDYDDGGTYSDGLNTPAGDNRRQPRGGIENSYPASSFATSRDRYWRNEEADQSAGSNYRDDDAQSDPADAYSLTSREYAYDAEWPKVWIPSRQNPWEGTCASNLVDTGNKTGLHFISLGIFEELGYTSEDMNSSDVRHIRRVEYPPYHTLGSINLNLSFQTTESHKTEQHAIQLHVVHDGLIEGYDLVFTKEPKIGLETESQGVLMMMVLDKTKESEAERRERKEIEYQRRKDKEKEKEKRDLQRQREIGKGKEKERDRDRDRDRYKERDKDKREKQRHKEKKKEKEEREEKHRHKKG